MHVRKRPIGLRNIGVDLACRARQFKRAFERSGSVSRPAVAVVRRVSQREARVRASKSRIELDRTPKHLPCGFISRALPNEQGGLPALVVLVSLKVARMALSHPAQLSFAYFRRQHVHDFRAEFILDREEVSRGTIEPLRPELFPGVSLCKVNVQAQASLDPLDRSGNEITRLGLIRCFAARSALHR